MSPTVQVSGRDDLRTSNSRTPHTQPWVQEARDQGATLILVPTSRRRHPQKGGYSGRARPYFRKRRQGDDAFSCLLDSCSQRIKLGTRPFVVPNPGTTTDGKHWFHARQLRLRQLTVAACGNNRGGDMGESRRRQLRAGCTLVAFLGQRWCSFSRSRLKKSSEATLPGGALESPRPALSPLSAAVGGMVAPAVIYLARSSAGITAAIGFTVSLFFATAAFPEGAALAETKMGALLSFGAAPLALVASRLLRARAT